MKKRVFVLLIISLFYITAKAQLGKEAWHWQFGEGVSLDFSSGVPVVGNSAINTREGSASISDPNTGQLLFYTDGTYVYNKNNIQMPNGFGLNGNTSTTQSALIVPEPGSINIYYVVTCDVEGGPYGVRYSVVDMTLNGGLGDVVSISKNTLLTAAPVTEKLIAVKQCNGQGYWIIDHSLNTSAFNAYKVTSSGINTTAVVSNVGTIPNGSNQSVGYLKASPNGKKLALGIESGNEILELYDFDGSTGIISNPITIPLDQGGYGVSFSPDNSKLYTSYVDGSGYLYQYDVSSGVAATIISSQKTISYGYGYGALQLGPDGKIYMAEYNSTFISVINNPNASGLACNFQASGINLPSGYCLLGLPNFIDANNNYTTINVSNAVQCNTFIADTLDAGTGFSSYQWSTGVSTQSIVVNNPGTYWVTVTNTNGCTITDTIKAYTINPNNIHILKDTIACSSTGSYIANATYSGAQGYQWYDGSTNPIKTISTSGTYSVNIYFPGGCVVQNTFNLTLSTKPNVNIGRDTILCHNLATPIVLNAGAGSGYIYNWSTGANTQTISVSNGGIYWVNVTSAVGCSAKDSIDIIVVSQNSYQTFDTSFCNVAMFPVTLHAPSIPGNNNSYYWNNGGAGITDYAYYPGTYILSIYVNGGACTLTDVYNVVLDTARPHIKDIVKCTSFKPDTITAGFGYASYLWSNGVTTYTAVISGPGTYWVKVTSFGGCTATDTFKASVINPADADILKDTVVCSNNFYYYANAYVSGAQSYQWYDGYTSSSQYFSSSGNYWVNIYFSGGCVVRDNFNLTLNQKPYVYLGNDEAICGPLATPIVLDAGFGFPHYQWSTGSTAEGIYVYTSGVYWVTVTATNGCTATDSVNIQVYPYGNTTHVIDTVICNRNPPFILSTGIPGFNNYSYWSNGYSGETDYIYNGGTYYVNVNINGSNSCIVTDTFHVSTGTITKPVIPNVFECNTTTADVLDAGPGYTSYNWSTGATTESISVNTSGKYMVTVTNSQGCKITDTVKVSYSTSPKITVLKDTSICNQQSLTADASYPGTTSYLWNDGFNYPIHTINTGTYWVTYTLNTTCIASDTFNVSVKQVKYIDALPNIVTPNHDGLNDFIDFGVYLFPNLQLEIYDRWGKKIFESNDPKCVWNPTCDDGTYFYVAVYSADCDVNQTTKTIKGFFTILK